MNKIYQRRKKLNLMRREARDKYYPAIREKFQEYSGTKDLRILAEAGSSIRQSFDSGYIAGFRNGAKDARKNIYPKADGSGHTVMDLIIRAGIPTEMLKIHASTIIIPDLNNRRESK